MLSLFMHEIIPKLIVSPEKGYILTMPHFLVHEIIPYPIQFCLIFGSQFDPSLVDIFQLANVVNQMNQLYIRGNKGNKSYLQFKRLAIFLCGL